MTEKKYEELTKIYRENPILLTSIRWLNKIFTIIGYLAYPTLLIFLYFQDIRKCIWFIVIPGISFVLLSWIRSMINAPRPYEVLKIQPLIYKDKKGESFPSRHVFSLFVIAGCWFGLQPIIGIFLCICGWVLAYIRVVGGIHFPKDVCVGMIVGLLCGLLPVIIVYFI